MKATKSISDQTHHQKATNYLKFLALLLVLYSTVAPLQSANTVYDIETNSKSGQILLLKNHGKKIPFVGVPSIAIVQMGNESVEYLEKGLKRHLWHVDHYQMNPPYDVENLELMTLINLYDHTVVVASGRNGDSYELDHFLNRPNTTIVHIGQKPKDKWLISAMRKAESLVVADTWNEKTQNHLAELLCGARSFRKITIPLEGAPSLTTLETKRTRLGYGTPSEVGMDDIIVKSIDNIVNEGLKAGAYPGAQVVVVKDGLIIYEKAFGYKDAGKKERNDLNTLYDLASVTKAASTVPLLMMAESQGLLYPNDKASHYLSYLRDSNKQDIKISSLLHHAAGMPAVIQFYREILIDPNSYEGALIKRGRSQGYPNQVSARDFARNDWNFQKRYVQKDSSELFPIRMAKGLYLSPKVRPQMQESIRQASMRKSYRYSDIDFLLLQDVLEQVYGQGLDTLFRKKIAEPLGLKRLLYKPLSRFQASSIAEGTNDHFLRKQTLRGDVDDEAAAMLGGVSGNAGLFGTAHDLAVLAQTFANGGIYGGLRFYDENIVRKYSQTKHSSSPYAMGFDKPRGKGNPGNTSDEAPRTVFGHTGFTGTCFWVDPDNQLVYVFLSNRVAPIRWNSRLSSMDIRTRIQSVLYRALIK